MGCKLSTLCKHDQDDFVDPSWGGMQFRDPDEELLDKLEQQAHNRAWKESPRFHLDGGGLEESGEDDKAGKDETEDDDLHSERRHGPFIHDALKTELPSVTTEVLSRLTANQANQESSHAAANRMRSKSSSVQRYASVLPASRMLFFDDVDLQPSPQTRSRGNGFDSPKNPQTILERPSQSCISVDDYLSRFAQADQQKLSRTRPNRADSTFYHVGSLDDRTKDFERGRDSLQKKQEEAHRERMLELDPDCWQALAAEGRYDEAEEQLTEAGRAEEEARGR